MTIPRFRDDGWLPEGHHRANWNEIEDRFGGYPGSRRASLTRELLRLHGALQNAGIRGRLLLDGSFISSRAEPRDFDVLIVADNDIQALRDADAEVSRLLDAEEAESRGYSLFFTRSNSPAISLLSTLWDTTRQGEPKGVMEVEI